MSGRPTPYPEVDIVKLGRHYTDNVNDMTEFGLHEKSDIAAQLGYRDQQIELLQSELEVANLRLQEGVTVMNARQEEYRAEIERLKALLEGKP